MKGVALMCHAPVVTRVPIETRGSGFAASTLMHQVYKI